MKDSCYGCEERSEICHGKDERGNWRCEGWGKRQEAKALEEKSRAEERELRGYFGDKHERIELKRKNHHA